jgi:phosphotransferase system enzyme I (PtsI)
MGQRVKGMTASHGIAIGQAFVRRKRELPVDEATISVADVPAELERFRQAQAEADRQLQEIYQQALATVGAEQAEVFEGHREILSDPELEAAIIETIEQGRRRAEFAITRALESHALELEELDNEYMRERAADLREISDRLMHCLAGYQKESLADLPGQVIVIAEDLGPAETAQMDPKQVVGLVVEKGGPTSHVAIMARSMDLPALVGASGVLDAVESGDEVILDGSLGELLIEPSAAELTCYRERLRDLEVTKRELTGLRDLPAVTLDGHQLELGANIGSPAEVSRALECGAEGIGLFRTEFLFMEKAQPPGQDEQFQAYHQALSAMDQRPVVVRTLDIGGDKPLCYIDFPKEENPFLGWRGIRMCLDRPEVIRGQLRALLRASVAGPLRIMYPMITSLTEVRQLNELLQQVRDELVAEGHAVSDQVEVGIMVETPAAAVLAPCFAQEVDFFSIGTNDLTQYTLAVDRGNQAISELYQPLHPALLALYRHIIDGAHQAGKWVGMCGELAANERAVPLLVGLGLDELSMAPPSIPVIKRVIRSLSWRETRALADEALQRKTTADVLALLEQCAALQGEASTPRGGLH